MRYSCEYRFFENGVIIMRSDTVTKGKAQAPHRSLMNALALSLGELNSNFINPHGLDDPNHYTTANDLAIITKYAMKNESFRKIQF